MKKKLQHYSSKDKVFLLEKLVALKNNDFSYGLFNSNEINKIELIEEHGFLSKEEISNIENIFQESNHINKLIQLEESLLEKIKKDNGNIDEIFNESKYINLFLLETIENYKHLYCCDQSYLDKFLKVFKNKNNCSFIEDLFINEFGEYKNKETINKEILELKKRLENENLLKDEKIKILNNIKNITKKIINKENCSNIASLFFLKEHYLKNKGIIKEKEYHLNVLKNKRDIVITKIPKNYYKRYTAEHEIMLIFYGSDNSKTNKNKYSQIKNEICLRVKKNKNVNIGEILINQSNTRKKTFNFDCKSNLN